MQTIEQFGQTIKKKYPQYSDIPDSELGQKMLAKYPQYKDMVQQTTTTPTPPKANLQTANQLLRGEIKLDLGKTSFGQKIAQRGENVVNEITNTQQNPIVSGLKATANIFGGITDAAGSLVRMIPGGGKVIDTASNLMEKGFSKVTDKISNTKLFQEAAMSGETGGLEQTLSAVSAGGDIANNILLGEGIRAGSVKAENAIRKNVPIAIEKVKQLTTQSEKSIENTILTKYEKGVKPLINAKSTPSTARAYRRDVVSAARAINENKANLNFADDAGDIVSGQNPKSLQQLSDAIEQTKKSVFTQYDNLAKQAGDAGVKVNLQPVASELDTIINSKSLKLTHPETIEYAKQAKLRYQKIGQLDAITAQDVIQNYNNSLQAYYRNPSYETASRASIDAMIANNMRKSLDDGITGLTGAQYQTLKNTYGALKAIEKDVIKASLRDARKNVKGLWDVTDVFSGGQVVSGLATLNPALIASGVAQKSIAEFYKFLNNPNRAIEKMFKAVEKSKSSSSPTISNPTTPTLPKVNTPSTDNIPFSPEVQRILNLK